MKNILIDSGFWYALYNRRDAYYDKANEIFTFLELGNVIIPYPTLYETINSRFCKDRISLGEFKSLIDRENFILLEDNDYKSDALETAFNSSLNMNRPLSLVDSIIREILSDDNLKIDYLITFNVKDFIDVCQRENITIWSE